MRRIITRTRLKRTLTMKKLKSIDIYAIDRSELESSFGKMFVCTIRVLNF